MFNKKTYRLAKKKYALLKLENSLKKNKINRYIITNKKLSIIKKQIHVFKIKNLICGNKNICSVTAKYKSVFNSLKISRHVINKLGNTSKLPNYSKLSW